MIKISTIIAIIFSLFFLPENLQAQDNPQTEKLALALSGGGSKGIAQVGVISLLEKEGIRPDFITGTSIGSILGGLYAIGYSIEDLEDLALNLDWAYYFDDELEREYFPIEERDAAERYQLHFLFKGGKITLPTGVVRGKKISLLLSRLTIPAHGIHDFDDFDIPFRGIATDVETGEAIVYGKGDLADVMRASMSIPSVFVPFEIDGKLLIDGGVVRNLPVEDAILMGADKTIAVDIGGPLYKKEDIKSILDVLEQTSSYRIVASNVEQAKLADIVINPYISDISGLSFNQNDTLMARGKAAFVKSLPEIKSLLATGKILSPRGVNIPQEIKVVVFEIQGCDDKQLKTIKNFLQIKEGKIYGLDDIESRIKKLYGSELVALAKYRLSPLELGYKLTIIVETQKGEYVRLSANYDSRLKAALLLNLTLRNRIFSGSKFNADLKISENPSLDIDYYVNTSTRPNLGWHLGGRMHFYPGLTYINDKKGDLFDIRHFSTEANVFATFNNRFLVSTGMGLERYVRSEEFFDPQKNNLRMDQSFAQFRFLRDSYNREHFPTAGTYIELKGKYSFGRKLRVLETDSTSSISRDNTMLRLEISKAFSLWKKVSPILGFNGGYIRRTENNYLQRFYLGQALSGEWSHINFSGLRYMERPVSAYLLGQFKLQIEPIAGFFTSLVFNYASYSLKTFEVNEGIIGSKVLTNEGSIYGLGLELGMHSRLGPVVFTTEYNMGRERFNFSLHVGHSF